jgi:hypothetical protein
VGRRVRSLSVPLDGEWQRRGDDHLFYDVDLEPLYGGAYESSIATGRSVRNCSLWTQMGERCHDGAHPFSFFRDAFDRAGMGIYLFRDGQARMTVWFAGSRCSAVASISQAVHRSSSCTSTRTRPAAERRLSKTASISCKGPDVIIT